MPIYVYECTACGAMQEHVQSVGDDPPPCGDPETIMTMPKGKSACGSPTERRMTAASFRFERGVGWDGWQQTGPTTISREVPVSRHITDPVVQRNPGSRKL